MATAPQGRFSFVDEVDGHVAVLSDSGLHPRVVRVIAVAGDAVGNSLTRDGRYLLIADGSDGADVLSVARAEAGARGAVLGTLGKPRGGRGAIEVTSSPDGHFAFLSIEDADRIAVYDLGSALADRFKEAASVGSVVLGRAVVGMAVSPDGQWLYATSELAAGASAAGGGGTLSVISVSQAERDPARAVVATVPAGCSPVRVAVSPEGRLVWVTARESDELLAFSASELRRDPMHALLAAVRVGEAPVGLALLHGGRQVIVADSNRFNAPGAHASLTVVNAAAALAHRPAVVGTIVAGRFPREMALEPGGATLLVSNFGSDQLEAVSLATLIPPR